MIEVLAAGPLTTVQDIGRPGLAHLGVGTSGAADRAALALANRLVGNAEEAAGLEVTLGGLKLRMATPATVAITGAPCPLRVRDRPAALNSPVAVRAGEQVEMGPPAWGVRTYLAVRGGLAVDPVLGSRSTDLLAGLGPPVLAAGQRLPVGELFDRLPIVDVAPVPGPPIAVVLRVLPGPRDDWFGPGGLRVLGGEPYLVAPDSDRVGLRLQGHPLERVRDGELPSEGMVEGALQVPPDGQPVLLLADHPVTGGYPVIGVVPPADIPLAAQARPGQGIRFRVVTG
ncbi:MAG: biotin-dependent carboxyltransferase family protein [Pseudonocardiales bacterium]